MSAGVLGLLGAGDAAVKAYAGRLSDFDLVEEMREPEVLESCAFAIKLRMIATLYARPVMYPPQPSPDDPRGEGSSTPDAEAGGVKQQQQRRRRGLSREDLTVAEVAARFAVTPHRAALLLSVARALTTRLPGTMAALWDGQVNAYKAQVAVELVGPMAQYTYEQAVANGASPLEAERAARSKARRVEERVLSGAADQTPSTFRQRVRRAVARVAPKYADTLCKRAARRRKVTLRTDLPDGIAILSAELSAADAILVWKTLDGEARLQQEHGDERTLDQLRADIFLYLLTHRGDRPRTQTTTNTSTSSSSESETRDVDGKPEDLDGDGANPEAEAERTDTDAGAEAECDADCETQRGDRDADAGQAGDDPVEGVGSGASTVAVRRGTAPARTSAGSTSPGSAAVPEPDSATRWRAGPPRRDRAHINVTVSLDTLTGASDEPGDLAGYGPITAQMARAIAFHPESTWRRLVTDPLSGTLLDYGRTKYRPPQPLDDHIRARDGHCPHCTIPAERCDIDHVEPYPYGTTSEHNLGCRCRRRHRLKHEAGWRDRVSTDPEDPPGTFTTTSPTGHQYTYRPPALGPIRQPSPSGDDRHLHSDDVCSDGDDPRMDGDDVCSCEINRSGETNREEVENGARNDPAASRAVEPPDHTGLPAELGPPPF